MQIAEVWRFPVKSMLGESVDRIDLTPAGVHGDRAHAVVDRSDGKVASAKNPRKWRALLACRATYVEPPVDGDPLPAVRISLPGGGETRSDAPDVDDVLSRLLGRDVTLASGVPATPVFEETWPNVDGIAPTEFIDSTRVRTDEDESVSDLALGLAAPGTFLDLAPVHLLTSSSLGELARRAPDSTFVPPRFRPNLVLESDADGFLENGWVGSTLTIGSGTAVTVMMPTMRCVMTTLAQSELPDDRAILKTAAMHNRVEIEGLGSWACVGAYAQVVVTGPVQVGDDARIQPPATGEWA